MAPFNTHFLIAERIWPAVKTMTTWPESDNNILYGQFCFGCTAPDVDKASVSLTQKDTHFFDRTGDYELMASQRSVTFIEQQHEFLERPFRELCPEGQAFILGYLCHLCVDEVSKHMWRRETWQQFTARSIGPLFAALDEAARQQIQDYPAIARSLCSLDVVNVIPRIPTSDLEYLFQGVCAFVQAESTEAEYLALVELFDRPTWEQRQERLQVLRAEMDMARSQTHLFQLDALVAASLAHSHQRLVELIEGRPAQPGYPGLN